MGSRMKVKADPRKPGMIIESGYWHKQSLVLAIDVDAHGHATNVVEQDTDGRVRNHCTQWEHPGGYGSPDMIITPQFEHDCDGCEFLGTTGRWAKRKADFYFCPGEPTVIARYSSDGPDYSSGIGSQTELLTEALTRARAWGHYTG